MSERARTLTAVICLAAVLAGTATSTRDLAAGTTPPRATNEARATAPRLDCYGDPLPDGALARAGTMRFRHGGYVQSLLYSRDGRSLITAAEDGLRVWDASNGKLLRWFGREAVGKNSPVLPPRGIDLSPDGNTLAAIYPRQPEDGSLALSLWDVATGRLLGQLAEGGYLGLCYASDGKRLAALQNRGQEVEIWDLKKREKVQTWPVHVVAEECPGVFPNFAFTADARALIARGENRSLRVWDLTTGKVVRTLDTSPNEVGAFAVSPDGVFLAAVGMTRKTESIVADVSMDGIARVWDLRTGKELHADLQRPPPAKAVGHDQTALCELVFRPDGKAFVLRGPGPTLSVYETASGKAVRRHAIKGAGWIKPHAVAPDGRWLASVESERSLRVLDLTTGRDLIATRGHDGTVWDFDVSPEGRYFLSVGGVNRTGLGCIVWETATGRPYDAIQDRDFEEGELAWADGGKTILALSPDRVIKVFDIDSGRLRRSFKAPGNAASMGQFLQGGRLFASTSETQVTVTDVPTGRIVRSLEGRRLKLDADSHWGFSPDGRLLFEAAGRNVTVTTVATGKSVRFAAEPVQSFGFPCDSGGSLFTLTDRGVVQRWDVDSGKEVLSFRLPSQDKADDAAGPPNPAEIRAMSDRLFALKVSSDAAILLETTSGRVVRRLEGLCDPREFLDMGSPVRFVSFSPDGRTLAWGGYGRPPAVSLFESASGKLRRRYVGHDGDICAVKFTPDGKTLLSGSSDTTILVWDLTGRGKVGGGDRRPLERTELRSCWADLEAEDAAQAYRAVHRLASDPTGTATYLRDVLQPAAAPGAAEVTGLISRLDGDVFADREKATARLAEFGELVLPELRKALAARPSVEVKRRLEGLVERAVAAEWDPPGARLREIRAVEALELAATADARRTLEYLAGGAPAARLTREARASLDRLARRQGGAVDVSR